MKPEDGNRDKNYFNDGAVGLDSLAVGAGAYADGTMGATALGNDAYAEGERALAIGSGSQAIGLDAIAIGTGSQGEANGTNAIAIGEQTLARGMFTTAVGSYSEATAQGAVALGMNSVADREAGWQGYHPVYGQMQDDSPAWQSTWGAVSVGACSSRM